jgi:tetratricopeptide (TPR) repeat protein
MTCLVAAAPAAEHSAATVSSDAFVDTWSASVRTHQAGQRDAALAAVVSWSRADWNIVYPRVLTHLRDVIDRGARHLSRTAFLKRAALLHTDIAMLEREANEPLLLSPSRRVGSRLTVRVPDGRFEGVRAANGHWEIARVLLDQISPSPALDEDVRRWYHVTAAVIASWYGFADLVRHFERGHQLFPNDPGLRFQQGCLYEGLASSRVQDTVATIALPPNVQLAVASATDNLHRAAEHFDHVAPASREWPEARVRLARVWRLLGREREAAEELRKMSQRIDDRVVQYLALMFLGQSEEGLGRYAPARDAYERAAALYPGAQSARLAIVNVDRREGRTLALDQLHALLSIDGDSPDREDPWRDYYRGEGRNMRALLDEFHARFSTLW